MATVVLAGSMALACLLGSPMAAFAETSSVYATTTGTISGTTDPSTNDQSAAVAENPVAADVNGQTSDETTETPTDSASTVTPGADADESASASDEASATGDAGAVASTTDSASKDAVSADASEAVSSTSDIAATTESESTSVVTASATAPSVSTTNLTDGVYQVSLDSSMYLGVVGGSAASGASADVSSSASAAYQRWYLTSVGGGYYTLMNMGSSLFLAAVAAENGASVQQLAADGGNAQKWLLAYDEAKGCYKLVSKLTSALVLGAAGSGTIDGTAVRLYSNTGVSTQDWCIAALTQEIINGTRYEWVSGSDNTVSIAVSDNSKSSGASIVVDTTSGSVSQQFRPVLVSGSVYYLANVSSGLCLTIDGVNLVQTAWTGSANQEWVISFDTADNGFNLRSVSTGKYLSNRDSLKSATSSSPLTLSNLQNMASTFLAVAAKVSELNGIDIASWEAGIDLASVASDFVFVKSSQGTSYVNPYYSDWVSEALSLGKSLGIYHFATGVGAVAEADYYVSQLQQAGVIGKAVLALDWENIKDGTDNLLHLGPSYALTFLNRVYELTGVKPLIYMSQSVTNSYDWSSVADAGYGLWVAQYLYANMSDDGNTYGYLDDPSKYRSISYWSSATIYQYSSTGIISGYGGNLDLNKFYGSTTDWANLAKSG